MVSTSLVHDDQQQASHCSEPARLSKSSRSLTLLIPFLSTFNKTQATRNIHKYKYVMGSSFALYCYTTVLERQRFSQILHFYRKSCLNLNRITMSRTSDSNSIDNCPNVENWLANEQISLVSELHLERLEERVLYSAVPVPVDLVEHVDSGAVPQDIDVDVFATADQGVDLISNGLEQYFSDDLNSNIDLVTSELPSIELIDERIEVVFIDQSVEDYQLLVDDILSQADPNTHYEIAFLNPNSNGLEQISKVLDRQSGGEPRYDAVHLVTHGSDATLNLGNTQVNGSNLHGFAHQFIGWQASLADGADILIYGCNVAETGNGEQFVQELADLTGADVAASDDLTGHTQLGGDWNFEVVVGAIESENVFTTEVQASWMHALAGEETTGESGTTTGRNLAINDSQTVVQVFAQDLGFGDGLDIFYQISDSNGLQSAVQVNTTDAAGTQQWASVAIDNDGDFVVVWTDDLGAGELGVFAKYFAADGSIIRDEFRVDPFGSDGNDASVAMDANGNFVVAWEGSGAQDSDGIYAQRFDVTGATVGSTFLVNDVASAGRTQGNADVAMNDSGQFVIAWDDFNSIYEESNIYARWYDTDGTPAGSNEILVDSDSTRLYFDPSVAINNSGNFAVAFTLDTDQDVKEGSLGGIAASVANSTESGVNALTYTVSGSTVTQEQEILVNDTTTGAQHSPSVTLLDNNELIVAWEGRGRADDGTENVTDSEGVFYDKFDLTTGNSLTAGGETFISQDAVTGIQQDAVVASNGNDFVFGFNDQGNALTLETSFNYAPVSENSSLTVPIGFDYELHLTDFDYFDAEGELLDHIIIDALPSTAQGQLLRSGSAISVGETISRTELENGDITFKTPDSSIGSIGSISFRSNDGNSYSSVATISLEAEYTDTLFISTKGAQSYDGIDWDQQDIVGLGGNDFNLGAPFAAEAYHLFNASLDLDAFHYASADITIPTNPTTQIEFGDVIFSVTGTANVPGIGTTQTGDIILFKPGSPGDYTPGNGTFSVLTTIPSGGDVKGITIVESNTTVGDFELQAGDILFTESSNANDIFRLTFSSGTPVVEKFIDGVSIGISEAIYGLELVESDTTVGGTNLAAGSLLLSFEKNENIGGTNVQDNDIANLVLTETELGSGNSAGTATVFFDSSEATNLNDGGDGDVTGISLLVQSAQEAISNNSTVTVDEASNVTISSAFLSATDADNTADQLQYNIASGPSNGQVLVSGMPSSQFTQQDINDGLVTYQHDGTETLSDSINLQLNDGFGAGTDLILQFTVNPINDSPVLTTNAGTTVSEGSSGNVITAAMLSTADADDIGNQLIYTLDSVPSNGQLLRSGIALLANESFTQQDIDDGLITYNHNGSETVSDSFEFTVADGGENGAISSNATFSISVAPVNDEQSVVSTATPVSVTEGSSVTLTGTELLASDVDNTATELVYTVTGAPANGQIQVSGVNQSTFTQQDINDGLVTYLHNGGESSSDTVSFSVDDGAGSSSAASLNFSVTAVNDEQSVVATSSPVSVTEGSSVTLTGTELLASDVDNTATELVYTVTGAPANGQIQVSGVNQSTFTQQDINDGLVTYLHNGGESSSDTVSFSVDDGAGSSSAASLNFSVTAVNDEQSVVATSSPVSVTEGSSVTLTGTELLASDVDNTATELVYTVTGAPANGQIQVSGVNQSTFTQQDINDGLVTYLHNGGESSSDTVSFSVDDGAGSTSAASLNFAVTAVNDEQIVASTVTPVSVVEGNSVSLTGSISASDADNSASELIYAITSAPTNGQILVNGVSQSTFTQQDLDDGVVTYTHDGGESSSDTASFAVDDGLGSASATSLNFSISPLNDAPVLTGSGYSLANIAADTTEPLGTTVQNLLDSVGGYSDAEGAALGIAVVSVDDSNGQWQYSLDSGTNWLVYADQGVSTIAADDSNGLVLDAHSLIRFVPATGFSGNAGNLSFRLWDQTDGMVAGDLGNVAYDGTTDSVSSNIATATLNVIPASNAAPIAVNDNLSVFAHDVTTIVTNAALTANDTDADLDALTITGFTQPANGRLELNVDGDLEFTPDAGFSGVQSFEYTISDGTESATATATFTVNDQPVAVGDEFSVLRNGTLSGDASLNDSDGIHSTLTYNLVSNTDNGVLTLDADGTFTYTPNASYYGTDSFTYTLNDGLDVSETAAVEIRVLTPPVSNDDHITVNFGESTNLAVLLNDYDPDGNRSDLTIEIVVPPNSGNLTMNATSTAVFYEATDDGANVDMIQYRLRDADGNYSSIGRVRIVINHAPTNIVLDNDTIDENSANNTVVGQVSASDLNNDIVSFELLDSDNDASNNPFKIAATTGEISVNRSSLLNFESATSFEETVIVTDDSGLTSSQTFTISLNDVNEAPQIAAISASTHEGGRVNGDVSLSTFDPENDVTGFQVTSGPTHGNLEFNVDGRWQYEHDGSENFSDDFSFASRDSAGNITDSTVRISITPLPDALEIAPDARGESVAVIQIPVRETTNNNSLGDSTETNSPSSSQQNSSEQTENNTDPETPIENENVAPESDNLAGPLSNSRGSNSTGTGGAGNDDNNSDNDRFLESERVQSEFEATRQKTLLWQPRYAIYGNQLSVESTLNDFNSDAEYQLAEQLEDLTGMTIGLSQNLLDDLNQQTFARSYTFSDIPILGLSASSMFTVGYLVWAIRAGALVSTFASIPAWTQFDPLPVIESGIPVNSVEDDDSLEQLVDNV